MRKSVFITGAGSGLGAAVALALAKNGWRLGLCGRKEAKLTQTAAQIDSFHTRSQIFALDVVNAHALDAAIADFRPTAVVCCAAILDQAPLHELTPERFAMTQAINVQGTFNVCRAAILAWRNLGVAGDIVAVSSLAGLCGQQKFPGFTAYSASKHAVIGLTESLAMEGRQHDIRVNAIAPGAFDTPMSRRLGLKPKATAEMIVPTIQYLLDRQQSGLLNGTTLEIQCNDD